MATTVTPASPFRDYLHRRRVRLHAKPHPHSQRRLSRTARLRYAPDGGGAEVSGPPASAAVEEQTPQERPEDFMLLAINRSEFNEIIMVIDSPVARYLVLDHNSTYGWLLAAYSCSVWCLTVDWFADQSELCVWLCRAENIHSILPKTTVWTNSYWVCTLDTKPTPTNFKTADLDNHSLIEHGKN